MICRFDTGHKCSKTVTAGAERWNKGGLACVIRDGDRLMLTFVLWCLLFVFSWPLALAALVLYPIVWLFLLPFRIVGVTVHGALALVSAIIMLPARVLRAI